jgi:hypothetical protein
MRIGLVGYAPVTTGFCAVADMLAARRLAAATVDIALSNVIRVSSLPRGTRIARTCCGGSHYRFADQAILPMIKKKRPGNGVPGASLLQASRPSGWQISYCCGMIRRCSR